VFAQGARHQGGIVVALLRRIKDQFLTVYIFQAKKFCRIFLIVALRGR
jgi:hypothetical protein